MKRTVIVTGAASGMGMATTRLLRDRGHRVIGVDLRNAEIIADLSTAAGRSAMVDAVAAQSPQGIDGVVAAAGVALVPDPKLILAVNYFGAVATLEGLRPMLAKSPSPRAVLIVSTAAIQADDMVLANLCLAGDEPAALAAAEGRLDTPYHSSKYAVGRWLRRAATSAEWAGAGILLNGIGPGRVRTPMIEPLLATEQGRAALAQATPLALDRPYGEPEDIAEVAAFMLEVEGNFLLGQILYVDGGTDAICRPDRL